MLKKDKMVSISAMVNNKSLGVYREMHLKQSLGDVIRQVIEEEHAMELMYNGQGGNRSICVGHLGFIMSLFLAAFCGWEQ